MTVKVIFSNGKLLLNFTLFLFLFRNHLQIFQYHPLRDILLSALPLSLKSPFPDFRAVYEKYKNKDE